jgi:hypothetical protein
MHLTCSDLLCCHFLHYLRFRSHPLQIFIAQLVVPSLRFESVPEAAVATSPCTEAEADQGVCTGTGGFMVYVRGGKAAGQQRPSPQWIVSYVGFGACYQVALLIHPDRSSDVAGAGAGAGAGGKANSISAGVKALLGEYTAMPLKSASGGKHDGDTGHEQQQHLTYKHVRNQDGGPVKNENSIMYYIDGLWVSMLQVHSAYDRQCFRSRLRSTCAVL